MLVSLVSGRCDRRVDGGFRAALGSAITLMPRYRVHMVRRDDTRVTILEGSFRGKRDACAAAKYRFGPRQYVATEIGANDIRSIITDVHTGGTAKFSADRLYRYTLSRTWDEQGPSICFIGLNPSTADASEDDPTVRRWRGFAQDWGYGGFTVVNLFAFRATSPKKMLAAADPLGSYNDRFLESRVRRANLVVACWGSNAPEWRVGEVRDMFAKRAMAVYCMGRTVSGAPRHPLYLHARVKPQLWLDARPLIPDPARTKCS